MNLPAPVCILTLAAVLLNGFLYAFSSALRNAPEGELRRRAEEGDRKAEKLERLVDEPKIFVRTTHALSCTALLVVSIFAVPAVFSAVRGTAAGHGAGPALQTALCAAACFVFLILYVAFGFLIPKKSALHHPLKTLYRSYGPVRFLMAVFLPLTAPAGALMTAVLRVLGMDPAISGDEVTEEELISIVGEAHEHGVIEKNEAEMIQNIMSFGDTAARDVMTHRNSIAAIDGQTALAEALTQMLQGSNSRYPVYLGDFDNIVGILHLKDAMTEITFHPENRTKPVADMPGLIREAAIFPESRTIDRIFQYMRANKEQMVVVVDEYGQTAGIICMEDILEEIVGSILDEYDDEDPQILREFDDSVVMDGMTPLDRVGEVLQVDFSGEEFETLNGYLTAQLGHIPTEKDTCVTGKGFLFQILKTEHHTIRKVRAKRSPAEENSHVRTFEIRTP